MTDSLRGRTALITGGSAPQYREHWLRPGRRGYQLSRTRRQRQKKGAARFLADSRIRTVTSPKKNRKIFISRSRGPTMCRHASMMQPVWPSQ
jgi:hypothetical protein